MQTEICLQYKMLNWKFCWGSEKLRTKKCNLHISVLGRALIAVPECQTWQQNTLGGVSKTLPANRKFRHMLTSSPSSDIQIGMGLPQYRLREMAQSRASASQLANRLSRTASGTLHAVHTVDTRSWSQGQVQLLLVRHDIRNRISVYPAGWKSVLYILPQFECFRSTEETMAFSVTPSMKGEALQDSPSICQDKLAMLSRRGFPCGRWCKERTTFSRLSSSQLKFAKSHGVMSHRVIFTTWCTGKPNAAYSSRKTALGYLWVQIHRCTFLVWSIEEKKQDGGQP